MFLLLRAVARIEKQALLHHSGQTGSGKTFSLFGSFTEPLGLILGDQTGIHGDEEKVTARGSLLGVCSSGYCTPLDWTEKYRDV